VSLSEDDLFSAAVDNTQTALSDYFLGAKAGAGGGMTPAFETIQIELPESLQPPRHWNWPPVIGVSDELLWTRYGTSHPQFADRGLVRVLPVFREHKPVDYLIVGRGTDEELISRYLESGDVGMIILLGQHLETLKDIFSSKELANQIVRSRIMLGTAAVPRSESRGWLDDFIAELSHNAAPDVAVARSTQARAPKASAGPVVLTPKPELDSVKVSSRSRDLAREMKDLPDSAGISVPESLPWPEDLPRSSARARDVGTKLDEILDFGEDFYIHESGGATTTAELRNRVDELLEEAAPAEDGGGAPPGLEGATAPQSRIAARYTDVTLYGFDELLERRQLGDEPLVTKGRYEIEVAVRETPQGLPSEGKRKPIPKADWKEDATIIVAVRTPDTGVFEFTDNCDVFLLPPTGDSQGSASIRFSVNEVLPRGPGRYPLEIRLYHRNRLLDLVVARPFIEERGKPLEEYERQRNKPLLALSPSESYAGLEDLGDRIEANALAIHVMPEDSRFRLEFFIDTGREKPAEAGSPGGRPRPLVLSMGVNLSQDDLRDILRDVRDYWWQLVMETGYGTKLDVVENESAKALAALEDMGGKFFEKLFPFRGPHEQANDIANWLFSQTKPGATIDVVFRNGAENFVFPWAMLCFAKEAEEEKRLPLSARLFGARFVIEQKSQAFAERHRAPPAESDLPAGMEIAVWDKFSNASAHLTELRKIVDAKPEIVRPDDTPVNSKRVFLDVLTKKSPRFLYFYSHGFTRPSMEDLMFEASRDYLDRIEKGKARNANVGGNFKESLELILQGGRQDDYIKLSMNKIEYGELERTRFAFPPGALVFMNMCESAQLYPGRSHNFVSLFLDSNAEAVIGTECPMTCIFADVFGRETLNGLLSDKPVGEALRSTRAFFLDKHNNPLGLAYTAYGSSRCRLTPSEAKPRNGGTGNDR
jgi:hypothetical protein